MMAEFAGLEDNWGLQAIVGGGGGSFTSAFCSSGSAISAAPNSCYGLMEMPRDDHDLLFSYPDLFETAAMLTDELEGLYKPFYPVSDSSPSAENIQVSSIFGPCEVEEKAEEEEQKLTCCPVQSAVSSTATAYVPKYKRSRKNQQKRVVLQVTAEDLSSDVWAWRKYGQKPIKGSPYPRSYYRCSSSKGCLARKQVEQSCKDPNTFIITYTAEHSHSKPTRKNALAGTIRHKFPNPKSPSKTTSRAAKAKDSFASSPASSSAVPSPRTRLIASLDNEYHSRNVKQEMSIAEIGEQMIDGNDDKVIFSGINLDDDFFSGLEDLDELISELANGHCSTYKQFPMS